MDDLVRVEFTMAVEFVQPNFPIHLDALLAYANVQRNMDEVEDKPTETKIRELANDLPIKKYESDGQWVFMSSALMPEGEIKHSSRFFTQRMAQVALAQNALNGNVKVGKIKPNVKLEPHSNKIDTKRGVFRNQLGFYGTSEAQKLVAYCVGNKELIEEMLVDYGYITHIGTKRRMGHGLIDSIELFEDQTASELWKRRVKPWQMLNNDTPVRAVVQNPYWDKRNAIDAFIPDDL